MLPTNDEQIKLRAYEIWEREGHPSGRDHDHWLMAVAELSGKSKKSAAKKAAAAPSIAGKAKAIKAAPKVKAPTGATKLKDKASKAPTPKPKAKPKA